MVTRAVGGRLDHRPVGGQLLLLVGHRRVGQEQVLGAVQADAGGADAHGHLGVGGAVDVGQQLDAQCRRA